MPIREGETILSGKYHILELMGEGGMARVWLAEEPKFGHRRVAIKEPRADLFPGDMEEVQRRYHQEIQLAPRLLRPRPSRP